MGRLKDKLAIITGGLGDLGYPTGRRLAEGGKTRGPRCRGCSNAKAECKRLPPRWRFGPETNRLLRLAATWSWMVGAWLAKYWKNFEK